MMTIDKIDLDKLVADFKIPDNLDLPDIDFALPELADDDLRVIPADPYFDPALPEGVLDLPDFSNAIEKEISPIKTNIKRKRGRPTIITEEWWRETAKILPDLFVDGASIPEVVGKLGISNRSFLNACQKSDDLIRAKKDGLMKAQAWWEGIGRKAMLGGIPGFNATVWVFSMKNKFGWRDKHDLKLQRECKIYIDKEDEGL